MGAQHLREIGDSIHDRSYIEVYMTSARGRIDMVNVFLDKGMDIDIRNGNGQTALQAASEGGHTDIVKLLLESKADIKYNGQRALKAATKTGNLELVNILKDAIDIASR